MGQQLTRIGTTAVHAIVLNRYFYVMFSLAVKISCTGLDPRHLPMYESTFLPDLSIVATVENGTIDWIYSNAGKVSIAQAMSHLLLPQHPRKLERLANPLSAPTGSARMVVYDRPVDLTAHLAWVGSQAPASLAKLLLRLPQKCLILHLHEPAREHGQFQRGYQTVSSCHFGCLG